MEKAKWRDVTSTFTESQRYYKDTYLEISEVLDDVIEVSIFSSNTSPYEIYVAYGKMNGIIYTNANEGYKLRESVKGALFNEYMANGKSKEPSNDFIKRFSKKFNLEYPMDLYFNFNLGGDDDDIY